MITISSIAEAASLIADPARANILFALKDDSAITSGDLSVVAGVAPSTASEHLSKLVEGGLVAVNPKGRKRYYRLAGPAVAEALEAMEGVAAILAGRNGRAADPERSMRHARYCYDHLAGRVGVQIADAMLAKNFIRYSSCGPDVTEEGTNWLASLGADICPLRNEPRRFARLCHDWSENAPHVGGAVGAAMLRAFVGRDLLRRVRGSRILVVTPAGRAKFRSDLGVDLDPVDVA